MREARNAEIEERYRAGETMREIGGNYGISHQRVQQILDKRGVFVGERTTKGVTRRSQRIRARKDREITAHRQAIIELVHQGLTSKEIVQRVRLSPELVRRVLDETFSADERRTLLFKTGLERVPKAQLLEQIREAYRVLGPTMGALDYDAYAKAHGWTGGFLTIHTRFGKWSRACALAGVSVQMKRRSRGNYKNFIDRATCLAAVREVRDLFGFIPSYAEYERYARLTRRMPCGTTVRKRCGGWRNVIRVLLMDAGPH